ncbi:hypothetical protein LTR66_004577 [Elasticomyces elasticus]|nr:hypothetical protein LTR66_004577 [Elasticomyces elasticus]
MDSKYIYQKVNKRYGSAAQGISAEYSRKVAEAFGYTADELASIPQGANLGLSYGNPLALAKLKEVRRRSSVDVLSSPKGETVIVLGSGAGFDVFLAAKKVGPNGKAIGVVADCIVSNCVINLVQKEEKDLVFKEMFRLLKPDGRVAISDILIKKDLPEGMQENIALYVGFVAGASKMEEHETYLQAAGFNDILIVDSKNDVNVYTTSQGSSKQSCCSGQEGKSLCCDSDERAPGESLDTFIEKFKEVDLNAWAGSFQVYALKA